MKVSLEWLKEYIETDLSIEDIAEILSDLGFPSEGIEYINGDGVNDTEVTSNRGDCLCMIGIARELSAIIGGEVKVPGVKLDVSENKACDFVSVEIEDPELCGRYTARIIEGVKVGPSPEWLVKRLEAAGMRSVNNVVDVTNYTMLETGQPPHAFDYDKLKGGKIVVRRAKAGERIVSIDGSKCDLDPEMLVIADAEGPVAIAGVMGGLDTEVTESTTTILLEEASFDPVSIRTASRRLVLPSESSFRFERIVDIENIEAASQRTAQLIAELAGGRVAEGVVDVYPGRVEAREVSMRMNRMEHLLGIDISAERTVEILSRLGFGPSLTDGVVSCTVPTWRSDISREVDLIEEVSRVYGFDKIHTEKRISIEVAAPDKRQKFSTELRGYLNSSGFYETVNVTFVDDKIDSLFRYNNNPSLAVSDQRRKYASIIRQSLVGSLLNVLKTNVNAKNTPCRIYELSDTFVPESMEKNALPGETTKLAMVSDCDFRLLRGVLEGMLNEVYRNCRVEFEPAEVRWAQAGCAVKMDGETIGFAGVVSESVREYFDFKEFVPVAAEIDFDSLMRTDRGDFTVNAIARFPAIERDLSLLLDENVSWSSIYKTVCKKRPEYLESVDFVDIYRGKGVSSGKKSVTLSLRFRDQDGTLTHEAVDPWVDGIVDELKFGLGASLRSV